jgi:hypothetical protein
MTVEAAAPAAKGRARDTRATTAGTVAATAAVLFLFAFGSDYDCARRPIPSLVNRNTRQSSNEPAPSLL